MFYCPPNNPQRLKVNNCGLLMCVDVIVRLEKSELSNRLHDTVILLYHLTLLGQENINNVFGAIRNFYRTIDFTPQLQFIRLVYLHRHR